MNNPNLITANEQCPINLDNVCSFSRINIEGTPSIFFECNNGKRVVWAFSSAEKRNEVYQQIVDTYATPIG